MNTLDDEIESILYICREVSVYKIPPLKANEGHRANDWGDLAKPLWKGRLRFIEKGETATLQFEDVTTVICQANVSGGMKVNSNVNKNIAVFAKTSYDPQKPAVEAVLDSSRYFVIRVEDNGRKAYIGMGFAERTDSFDFNVSLQDYTKRFFAKLNPPSPTTEKEPGAPAAPKKDYSLKEGQTFSIKIPGRIRDNEDPSSLLGSSESTSILPSVGASFGGGIPLLPPPPSSKK